LGPKRLTVFVLFATGVDLRKGCVTSDHDVRLDVVADRRLTHELALPGDTFRNSAVHGTRARNDFAPRVVEVAAHRVLELSDHVTQIRRGLICDEPIAAPVHATRTLLEDLAVRSLSTTLVELFRGTRHRVVHGVVEFGACLTAVIVRGVIVSTSDVIVRDVIVAVCARVHAV
jgi:hypothetical protein